MTKKGKTFVDSLSPAMQFLSPAPADQSAPTPVPETQQRHEGKVERPARRLPRPGASGGKTEEPPKGYKINPLFIEKKTRRVQLVFQPSLYDRIKRKANREKVSVNECVHAMLASNLEKDGY